MDSGVIVKIKDAFRKLYGTWAYKHTMDQLLSGTLPKDIRVPSDVPSLKSNLFLCLSQVATDMNKDTAGVVRCWAACDQMRAWERTR